MMNGNYYFWGMGWFWWCFWVIIIIVFLILFEPVPKQKAKRNTALDILQKRFASGEISKEEYEEKKKVLEKDTKNN